MSLLLDTHVLLWVLSNDPRLAEPAREAIADGRSRAFVSAVSAWEITIKKALGRLRAPDDLPEQLARLRLTPLSITVEHGLVVGSLPDHHADPFDRMLIAQAMVERLTLVTRDQSIRAYDVATLEA